MIIPVRKWLITMVIVSPLNLGVIPQKIHRRTSWLKKTGVIRSPRIQVLGAHPPSRGPAALLRLALHGFQQSFFFKASPSGFFLRRPRRESQEGSQIIHNKSWFQAWGMKIQEYPTSYVPASINSRIIGNRSSYMRVSLPLGNRLSYLNES